MPRVGVFVCWCGSNIGGVLDCPALARAAATFPGVVYATDYQYMCSDPGQKLIAEAIKEHRLDRVVVAACSPRLHEDTFREVLARAGLNPYLLEMTNLREHCSWVHAGEKELAQAKALSLIRRAVAKALRLIPLHPGRVKITRRCLVIGGGIAGIQAALDVADAGIEVVLVEREPSLGGKMVLLDKTFPTLDCSACISTPKMAAVAKHPLIRLYTYAEVEKVEGSLGNYRVIIRQKARYVDHTKCTGCGTCWEKCPVKVPDELNFRLSTRPAIYLPFPQAVPNKPVIDARHCRQLTKGKCGVCQKVCPAGAIDYTQQDSLHEEEVGAIIVATGFDLFPWEKAYGEYGYGRYPDVITGLAFERLVNASGPTGGRIVRPSDGREPRTVVFVHCVGSRDELKGREYCSRICCMYTAKHAHQVKERLPEAKVYVFYIDIRTFGKGYEEFYRRVQDEGVIYLRGRVSKIYQEGDKLIVKGADTLLGEPVTIVADLVVLATGVVPAKGAEELARTLGISVDKDGFFQEAHPKLRPVETHTAGIFLAGACQGPKDIPDTVSQASAAAAKAVGLLLREEMAVSPLVAWVNQALCTGCLHCQVVCPYQAIEVVTEGGRRRARVKEELCQGCGSCTVACRPGAMELKGFSNGQILAEVEALCR
ncbi:4Fe-4S ferredoxin iron-sulfur binding domain protein [Ammonifex degensii KC4]|uniref:4Fe-4S ferredoxin iron-sulfur binding domain protein n=1 Tax=Ammonifex degensii (strain DSM 10501 / KC4) TaxID=429009 RepID=C9R811_AMMDK|nr:CoB--CoM heterodisulfide reductase iron-sulfur subunit A family protein [Ammonifex degensii]ACX52440.1 4Fe-4S ferredoxin iron-sulfur binding domain protein [Ammonifex degensii KC4]